ncbi:MAG: hypothetical protein ABJA16_13205 [Nakamurella sp.]
MTVPSCSMLRFFYGVGVGAGGGAGASIDPLMACRETLNLNQTLIVMSSWCWV